MANPNLDQDVANKIENRHLILYRKLQECVVAVLSLTSTPLFFPNPFSSSTPPSSSKQILQSVSH